MSLSVSRDFAAEYRAAIRDAATAATFAEQGAASDRAERILDDADTAGVRLDVGELHDDVDRELGNAVFGDQAPY